MGISPSQKDRIRVGHVATNLGECAVIALFVESTAVPLGVKCAIAMELSGPQGTADRT